MIYVYEVETSSGTIHHLVSDSGRLSTVSDKAEIRFATSLKSVKMLGEAREVNEHGGESITNMKAEIEHHIGRLEETLLIAKGIANREYDDMRAEILHIRELIK